MYRINDAVYTGDGNDIHNEDFKYKYYVGNFIDGTGNRFQEWDAIAEDAFKQIEAGERVIVCCQLGISRSNAMALTILLKLGYDFEFAFKLIRERNPIAQIEWGLVDDIKRWYGVVDVPYTQPRSNTLYQ